MQVRTDKDKLGSDEANALEQGLAASLSSAYLASWSSEARQSLCLTVQAVAPKLDRWASSYPEMNRRRVLPLVLSVAAAAPFCQPNVIESTARMSLWVFALDDMFDEQRYVDEGLVERAKHYQSIAIGPWSLSSSDGLATALQEIRQDLASYPLFRQLEDAWATGVCQTIQGMLVEQRWNAAYREQGSRALPTYEEYVENGLRSIGGPPHVWSALVAIGDSATPNAMPHLQQMERAACACIRLANDLQSEKKEALEGKVNSITILSHEYAAASQSEPDALARERVRSDIASGLARLSELERQPVTGSGLPERAIDGIARFVCEFYGRHDYHTFIDESGPRDSQASPQGIWQW